MWRVAAVFCGAALVIASAAAGPVVPVPVDTRAEAIAQLKAAIEDELRVIELINKKPPRVETARDRIDKSVARLSGVSDYLSGIPGGAAAEEAVRGARADDWTAYLLISAPGGPGALGQRRAIEHLERALLRKRGALRVMPDAQPPAAAQCSDGKDNDGDGITDWTLEPGCTSARDVRESSRFSCAVESRIESGRLALSGSCSGAFSEAEFTFLDDVRLDGRYDVMHAPSCGAPTLTGVRCKTKDGAKNPNHLIDARFLTTSKDPNQRVQLRFFDIRKRQIGRFVVPPLPTN